MSHTVRYRYPIWQELSRAYPVFRNRSLRQEPFSAVAEEGHTQRLERSAASEDMGQRYTAKYWRQRAQEARAVALHLRRPERRRIMLDIAEGYERIANTAECFSSRDYETNRSRSSQRWSCREQIRQSRRSVSDARERSSGRPANCAQRSLRVVLIFAEPEWSCSFRGQPRLRAH